MLSIGREDDLCHCVSVKSLEDMPEDVELFLESNVGASKY